jgi:chromosome segregation ATPase
MFTALQEAPTFCIRKLSNSLNLASGADRIAVMAPFHSLKQLIQYHKRLIRQVEHAFFAISVISIMELSGQGRLQTHAENLQVALFSPRRLLMSSLNHITDLDSAIQQALDENREAIQRTYEHCVAQENLLQETRRDQDRMRRTFQEMENALAQAEHRIERYLGALRMDEERLKSRQRTLERLSEKNRQKSVGLVRSIVNEDTTPRQESRKRPAESQNKASLSHLLSDPEELASETPPAKRLKMEVDVPHHHPDVLQSPILRKPSGAGSSVSVFLDNNASSLTTIMLIVQACF